MPDPTFANLTPPADAVPDDLRTLADGYFAGDLDAGRMAALESRLTADVAARRFFVRYAQLDRDLRGEAHARRQADAALAKLGIAAAAADANRGGPNFGGDADDARRLPGRASLAGRFSIRPARALAVAAAVAVAAAAGWWVAREQQDDRVTANGTAADGTAANRTAGNGTTPSPAGMERTEATAAPAAGKPSPTNNLAAGGSPAATAKAIAAGQDVAWLVNAQNCQWAAGTAPSDMKAGTRLDVDRGLAEIRFRAGAVVLLEGPARLELLSDNSARLLRGRLTGRVDGPVKGFELLSPRGKVIDLGTEFGVSVADGGETDVYVFQGKVQAVGRDAQVLDLTRAQSARLEVGGAAVRRDAPAGEALAFVRDIVPPPVVEPRTTALNFGKAYEGTVADAHGFGTGLAYRLPGTGAELPASDPNLVVNADEGRLELTTSESDINGQARLPTGEYLGVRLADLGFTGTEDFEVQAFLPNVPALQNVGQFGLYAGARSDKVIRGGLISRGNKSGPAGKPDPSAAPADARTEGSYTVFMTNNADGRDRDSHALGLFSMGDDLRVRLKRAGGKYALTVENVTTGSASTLSIRHPGYLDAENDLYVGLFGANTQSQVRRTLFVKEFAVTVWTTSGGKTLAGRTLPATPVTPPAGDEGRTPRAAAEW
jgi:hypothetical protein